MDSSLTKKILDNKDVIFRVSTVVLTVLTLIASIVYGKTLIKNISFSELEVNNVFIALSVLSFILFYKILAIHWSRSVALFTSVDKRQENAFYASQPYKYLPTSLFVFSFRAGYAKKLGVGFKDSSKAQVVEMMSMFISGGTVFCLFYAAELFGSLIPVLLGLSTLVLLFFRFSKAKSLKLKKFRINLSYLASLVVVASAAWIIAGISYYFLSAGLGADIDVIVAIYSNCASYILSILAFFAPGGIGIREASLQFFGSSATVVVGWRLFTLTIDLIMGAYGMFKIHSGKSSLL